MNPPGQPEFDFSFNQSEEGYNRWREERWQTMRQLSRKIGLPLERRVEVWLRGEIRLCGILRLREDLLWVPQNPTSQLELTVDKVSFTSDEMISCVAVD